MATGEPVIPETRFATGSLTKPMVATVIARLAEMAHSMTRLRRTCPRCVRAVGDDRGNRARPARRSIRASALSSALEFGFDDHPVTRRATRLCAEVPAGAPRDFWSYTNVGWCLLGRLIETTTGETWEDAMRRYLFDPTAMSRTTFAGASDRKRRVSGTRSRLVAPSALSRRWGERMDRPERRSFRRCRTYSGSPPCTFGTHRLPRSALHTRNCRSTAGSIPGVSVGPV